MNSMIDPMIHLQKQPVTLQCKQETESDELHYLHPNQFVKLPQLESPSLTPANRRSSKMTVLEEEDEEQARTPNGIETVTDWRALDKFVASQLGQQCSSSVSEQVVSDFVADNDSEMALLLLQSETEGVGKFNEFLSSGGSRAPIWLSSIMSLAGGHRRGYAWALSAGLNAALAAVSAKFVPSQPDALTHLEVLSCRTVYDGAYRVLRQPNYPSDHFS
ncbi:hypothetical protein BHM03_00047018 [Ensete ventricosum]|nr:hypothetical protein BHM03_00047018 [Ensete ventricosum]